MACRQEKVVVLIPGTTRNGGVEMIDLHQLFPKTSVRMLLGIGATSLEVAQ